MREVCRRLYARLQEAEREHQEEKEKLQVCTLLPFVSLLLHPFFFF